MGFLILSDILMPIKMDGKRGERRGWNGRETENISCR